MSRRKSAGEIFAAFVALGALWCGPSAIADDARDQPMHFTLRHEGPAKACGDHCKVWVSATGSITPDTPREFEDFARHHNLRRTTIAFDSEGGSVLGALALGRDVRHLDMTATVGRTIDVSSGSDRWSKLDPAVDCESMCVFLVLAGSRRFVPPEARLMVHQIWLGDRRGDATSASYSARDLMVVQRDIGRLVQYTSEMGGSADLIEMALRIPPWEPMHTLTRDEVHRMGLATMNTAFATSKANSISERNTDAVSSPTTAATAAPATTSSITPEWTVSERGWTLISQSGAPVLARRNMLTVEGEDIGSFDLMLGCGETSDSYVLTYMEVRDGREGEAAPKPLKSVTVSTGSQTRRLAVASSVVSGRPGRLFSVARAKVPATMFDALSDQEDGSILVSTRSRDDSHTTIRVGNSGAAQHLPELGAACTQAHPARNARAELRPAHGAH